MASAISESFRCSGVIRDRGKKKNIRLECSMRMFFLNINGIFQFNVITKSLVINFVRLTGGNIY